MMIVVVVVIIWGSPQFHLIIQIMSLFSICKLSYVVIHLVATNSCE